MEFPLDGLRMGDFVTSSSSSSSSSSRAAADGPEYKLYGMVIHHGRAMDQGHFTAMALAEDGDWYEFNDHRVRRLASSDEVKSQQAYLLVYERR